ncbi:ethanolamine kinase 1 [Galendromus occidentalis]|uniref:ethanolamine kinase n=1 Tax=Galendromus occidentalis TaxID=34638 RepID=A0AAJ6QSZ0_9ACAR|nr:ethanolamine kinase 1 [Galendromus occidentalis]
MTVACNKTDAQGSGDSSSNRMRWQQNRTAMAERQSQECARIQRLNNVVDISSEETIRKNVAEIARIAFPSCDTSKLSYKVLTGGLTNKLFLCEYSPSGPKFLCRIYGEKTEQFIDREAEIQNMHFLYSHGMGPRVHCTFRNGVCYDFFPGQTFDLEMATNPKYSFKIAEHMARMHTIPLLPSHGEKARIESMLDHYLSLVPLETIQSAEKRLEVEFKCVDLRHEVSSNKKVLRTMESAVVFCHNDLLPKNILLGNNDEIYFIDYEYASSNYQAFDIGNYFTEFGGQESYDRSLYPGKDWQLRWIRSYLTEYHRLRGTGPPSDTEIETMYIEVNKLALSSMLLWGIWALIQAANSTIDVDFVGFAILRLGMYFYKRDEFLAL